MTSGDLRTAITVLDQNPLLAEGVCALLNQLDGVSARSAVLTNDDRLWVCDGQAPDILLLDPDQTSMVPSKIVAQVHAVEGKTALIGYCSGVSSHNARNHLAAGFRGLLPKTASFTTLRAALAVVAQGGIYLDASYADALLDVRPAQPAAQKTGYKQLSDREFAVLKSVALGMSAKEIGNAMDVSSKTVETYKARATSKLNLQGRRAIVDFAIRNGWVQPAA